MDVVGDFDVSSLPEVPALQLGSMSRTINRLAHALDVDRQDAARAAIRPLVGGVMPDVSLSALESVAAVGHARVRVLIETEDGRVLSLTDIV